jgi:hypothetical protein
MHLYITRAPKENKAVPPLKQGSKVYSRAFRPPVFTAQQLYEVEVQSRGS